jgi:hypothetical protein
MSQLKAATPASDMVAGEVINVEPSYPREVGTGWHILVPLLAAAGAAYSLWLLIATILRTGASSGSGRRSLKDLRKGPEFLVTEFTIRLDDGSLLELEAHGHLATSALLPKDRVRARLRKQKRKDLPPRAAFIHNYTSGRDHGPPTQTLLMHLGPGLLMQAFIGLTIIALIVTAWAIRG